MTLTTDIETRDAIGLLSRRRFLQGLGVTTAGLALTTSWPLSSAFAGNPIGADDGILVFVILAGGNDGVNTIVPYGSGLYYDKRAGISIPAGSVLPIGPGVGLHPSLTYLKTLYDAGQVAIVDGVGVTAGASLSHFDSMATWMRGMPGVSGSATGWLGRWLDGVGDGAEVLTGVTIGHEVPLHMLGAEKSATAITPGGSKFGVRTEVWEQQLYTALRELEYAESGLGPWGNLAVKRHVDALEVGRDIQPVYATPINGDGFVRDLTLSARLINANVGARVISFIHGDFDHHSGQLWAHAELLGEIDEGLRAFFTELAPDQARRTTVMFVSEFGRTPRSNASAGTDHGTAGPVLLVGPPVAGGLYGSTPSFANLDAYGRFRPTVDFRDVYATVIDRCLGGGSSEILGGTFATLPLFRQATAPGTPPTPPPLATPKASFIGLTPERRLDTRSGLGVAKAPLGSGSSVELKIAGLGEVPPSGVTAVVMNVTVTEPAGSGFITVWPTGEARPEASHLNYTSGQTVPNLVLSKLGSDGRVSLYAHAGPVHLIADVVGYYSTSGGSTLVPLSPVRLVDTRSPRAPLGPGSVRDVVVTGTAGVPGAGVSGVVLNVTVTEPTAAGYLTVWPAGEVRPLASSLNFLPGQTVPNLVTAKVGSDGRISVFNNAGDTHVVIDIAGYFLAGGDGGRVVVSSPTRLMDTRRSGGALGHGVSRVLDVTVGAVPSTARAVVLNVTVTEPTRSGYLTVWPNGRARPEASNLNFVAGQTVPNQVIAAVGPDGKICLFNSAGSTHVIVDLMGWYV